MVRSASRTASSHAGKRGWADAGASGRRGRLSSSVAAAALAKKCGRQGCESAGNDRALHRRNHHRTNDSEGENVGRERDCDEYRAEREAETGAPSDSAPAPGLYTGRDIGNVHTFRNRRALFRNAVDSGYRSQGIISEQLLARRASDAAA